MSEQLSGPHAHPARSESVFELPGKSLRIVKKYWKLFAFVNLPVLLLAIMTAVDDGNNTNNSVGSINSAEIAALIGFGAVAAVLFVLISSFFYVMTIKLSLDAVNNRPATTKELIDTASKYWLRLIGLGILMALIIGAGLILLIIPGIIAAILLSYAPTILVDKNTSIIDALKGSYQLVSSNLGLVLSALLVVIGIGIAASLIKEVAVVGPVIGTIISIVFSLILFLRYQEIKNTVKI